jgi:hypothetical protein
MLHCLPHSMLFEKVVLTACLIVKMPKDIHVFIKIIYDHDSTYPGVIK